MGATAVSPVQIIKPVKGGRAGAVAAVLHVQRPEEAQLQTIYSGAQLAELVAALGGEGRGAWAVVAGDDAGALASAPNFEGSTVSAEHQANEVTDWLSQHSSNRTETLIFGAIVSTPKSWALAAVGDQDLQRAIQAAVPTAAQAYADAMRVHSTVRIHDRSAPTKKEQERKEQPVALRSWAASHAISGAGDPHLHVHMLTATRARGSSGKWGHLWQRDVVKKAARIAQAAAMYELRQAVTNAGYALDEAGEIVGIGQDRKLIEAASRAQTAVNMIQAAMVAQGIPVDHEQAWRLYRQVCAGHKVEALPEDVVDQIRDLRGSAKSSEALEHALDAAFADDARRADLVKHWSQVYDRDLVDLAKEAREQAQRAPVITPADQVVAWMASYRTSATDAQALAWCVEAVGPAAAEALMDHLREDPRVIAGRDRWATTEQAVRENEIVERVANLVPHVEMDAQEALARVDVPLTVVSGVAGAGKSALLVPAQRAWGSRTVWVAARNRYLADEIGRTLGCRSLSMAALATRVDKGKGPAPGDILVVDEVALLDHPHIQLVLELAEAGVLTKCLGDDRQLATIDGTTSARLLVEAARMCGQPWLETSRRCEAWRETHDALRAAVEDVGNPDLIDPVLNGLRIMPITKATDAIGLNSEAELIAATNATRVELAEALARPPEPADERLIARARDDVALWNGDRIVCRDGIYQDGRLVLANGERGQVVTVGPKSVIIRRTRDDEEVAIARHEVEDSISLGGAWTADAGQGQTFQQATAVLTGFEPVEWLYSATTRSQAPPTVAVVVPENVPEDRRQQAARDIVAGCLGRSRRAGTVLEMAQADDLFDQALQARLHPPEQEQTVPEASVAATEPQATHEVPGTAQELPQAPEAPVAPVVGKEALEPAVQIDPAKWYTQDELDAARTSWVVWRQRELARVPPVVVVDEAAMADANAADRQVAGEADRQASELRAKADAAEARRAELVEVAEDAYLMARDLAQVVDAGPGRFGRRAERVEQAKAERDEIAEQWGEQQLPGSAWTDEQARWRGNHAANRIVDARVAELARQAEREAGSARAVRALVERREAQANQARGQNARSEAKLSEVRQTMADKLAALDVLEARRAKLVAELPPEVVAGADEARTALLAQRHRQQQAEQEQEQEQERQRQERQQYYQPPPVPEQSYGGTELTL